MELAKQHKIYLFICAQDEEKWKLLRQTNNCFLVRQKLKENQKQADDD